MNARNLGLVGLLAAVAAGCHSDPTNSLVGKPTRVGFQFATVRLEVADSLATFAVVEDEGSTPINQPVTITACDPTTVSVSGVASGTPLVQTNFFIKGVKFGVGCVVATADGLVDTMQVQTVPDHISVTAGPDSLTSGDSGSYTFGYFDKKNTLMTGPAAPVWSVSTKDFGVIGSASALYKVHTPGGNTITATFTLASPLNGVTQTLTGIKVVSTVPIVYTGTLSAHSAAPGATILLEDPIFTGFKFDTSSTVLDSTSAVSIGGVPTYVTNHANDSIRVVIPPFANTNPQRIVVIHLGANRLSVGTGPADSVNNTTASLHSPFFPGDTSPATAPTFTAPQTAADTTIIVGINSGACIKGGASVGGTASPGDHCDSYFLISNPGASPVTVNFQTDWYVGASAPIQDMYICEDATCTGTIDEDGVTSGTSTPTNPEQEPGEVIPPGGTFTVWVNNAVPAGQKAVLFRVLITQ